MTKLTNELRADLRLFAFYLANGTLDDDVLGDDLAYESLLLEPSVLEQIFAVWGNVVELNERGEVVNAPSVHRRVAQWIRGRIDPTYSVDPPFAPWELELHL
jgi:hypothetical protein